MDRPNFLVVCVDQMRADHAGFAGNGVVQTPNLDALAASGTQFERAYVNCPLCMPSRATLFTGLTPRGHGVRTNGIPLNKSLPTVTGALRDAGYRTASVGKLHFSNYWLNPESAHLATPERFPELTRFWREGELSAVPTPYYGFEHVDITLGHGAGVEGHYARWLREEHPEAWQALQRTGVVPSGSGAEQSGTFPLEESLHHTAYVAKQTQSYLKQLNQDSPFFLFCSFPDPHHPYVAPEPWDRMYRAESVPLPVRREGELDDLAPFFRDIYERDMQLSGRGEATKLSDAHTREIIARTYGMVSLLDKYVGEVLGTLEEQGLSENTVVVFLSDHGDMMGDHHLMNKGPFHFEGLLRVPLIWRWPGRIAVQRTEALASLLDVAPTLLSLAGVPVPEGETSDEAPRQAPAWPGRSLLPCLTEGQTVQESVVVENDEDYLGLRLRTLITPTHKVTTYTGHRGAEPYGELFDLEHDPDELHNLWSKADHEETKRRLIERLHYRLVETDSAAPRRLSHA